jgi:hypothetical protein
MADIPDLNDPNTRLGRDAAMDAMRARRRETVMKDMDPDEAAALAATPLVTTEKKEGTDEDTDAGDAAAQAERARLEAEAAKTVEAVPAKTEEKPAAKTDDVPVLDAAKQAQVQTDTDPLLLTDDDLKAVKVKMVVNGQERLVTGAELLAEAQKVAGADDYLKLAKQVLGAAREAPVTPAVTTPAKVADEPAKISAEMEADIDAAVDAVFTGKDDDVKANLKKALLKLTPSAKPAEVTANQLREMEQYLVTRSELRQFAKDHKAIVDDEIGRRICDEFVIKELNARNVNRLEQLPAEAIHEVLEKAAAQTVPYIPALRAAPAASPGSTASTLSERLNRKKTIDELPSAATRSATQVPTPKTTTDVLNEMRKARGQIVIGG